MLIWTLLACGPSTPTAITEPTAEVEDHEEHGHPKSEHARHRFDDVEKWSKVFDDPERDGWQSPAVVVSALELKPGMVVADIGAGTGYFNRRLAEAVGADGKVIAIDIEPTLIEHMKKRADKEETRQVEARLTKPADHGLSPKEADRVLLVDTYHHIEDREAYFARLRNGMKPGGELVIVDLTKEAPFGPPAEERLTPTQVEAELKAAGWMSSRRVRNLEHQYVLVFSPSS